MYAGVRSDLFKDERCGSKYDASQSGGHGRASGFRAPLVVRVGCHRDPLVFLNEHGANRGKVLFSFILELRIRQSAYLCGLPDINIETNTSIEE